MAQKVTFSRVAVWTLAVVSVLLAITFLWFIRNVLFLLFLSILLATGIEPVVNALRRGPFNRSWGILFVYTMIFLSFGLVLYLTIPPLVDEGRNLVANFTDPQKSKASIQNIENEFLRNLVQTGYESFNSFISNFKPDMNTITLGLTVFEVIFSSLSVFVIAYYWLTERSQVRRYIAHWLREENRPRFRTLWSNVEEKLGAWVRGQLLMMLFIGVLSAIGYTLLGLKFALVLAFFAAITELIPMVGPYIGGAPAVLIALTQDFTLTIFVVVFIIVLQFIEGNLLVPRVMEKAVGVTPLTVIIGILVGSALAGISGALLAVPVAAAIQVIINNLLSFSDEETSDQQAVAASVSTKEALQVATNGLANRQSTTPETSGSAGSGD